MRKFRMVIALTLVLCMCLSITALAAESGYDGVVKIVHTNDVHSNVAVEPYVKGYVDSLRAAGDNVVLISAGDAFKGTAFASMTNGLDVATVMNMVGYEIITIGNHEQMLGTDAFKKVAEKVEFPILAANMGSEWRKAVPEIKDYVIKEFGGTKIAFIGITVPDYGGEGVDGIINGAERAKKAAEAEGATVFIAVTHLGVKEANEQMRSTYLAEKCPWLTAIIDGHCHSAHEKGLLQGDVLIAETGEYGNNIGVVELTFKSGKVTGVTSKLIPIKGKESECGITPDAEVQAFIDEVNAKSADYLQEVVATTPVDLDGAREFSRTRETNLGNIVTDAMRTAAKSDIAFVMGTFLRINIPAGDITREMLMQAMYEETDLCIVEVTGKFIFDLMTKGVSMYPKENSYFFTHVSGINVEFSPELGNNIVGIKMADGSAFDLDAVYTCALRADNAKNYLEGYETTLINATICEAVADYLNSGVEVSREAAGRIKPVEKTFSDLTGHWAKDVVYEMLKLKNITGYPDGTFRPNAAVTLDEFKKVLTAAYDLSDEDAAAIFPADGSAESVARKDAALLIKRMVDLLEIKLPQGEVATFTDIGGVSAEAAEAIKLLQRGKIINGVSSGLYAPDNETTRCELATIVSRLLVNAIVEETAA